MSPRLHTLIFAILLSLVCSALLAAVSWHTQPLYKENQEFERKRLTLEVFKIDLPEDPTREKVDALYKENINELTDENGNAWAYEYKDPQSGEIVGVGFPASGDGLWGKIRGMIAMQPNLETLMGVLFLEHQETPGLGAKITEAKFRDRFVGQQAVDAQGEVRIEVVSSSAQNKTPYQVDGITGATLTGDGVTKMLQKGIRNFRERYQK
jgi:Na+-transporting NADH:ubiquinone oxidoreductase subunit C